MDVPGKGTGLKAESTSPLYITVSAIKANINGKEVLFDGDMISPMSSAVYTQPKDAQKINGNISEFSFVILNEYGSQITTKMTKSGAGFSIVK